jgi:hypothetical protein
MSEKCIAIILIGALLILSVPGVAVYDYLGVNDKYQKPLKENYEKEIGIFAPSSGLLEVSCFIWEDHVSMTVTVDNTSVPSVGNVLYAGLRTYINFYNEYGFPDKAEIGVNKPGGQFGTQIGSGTVYSKWVKDYDTEMKIGPVKARNDIIDKFADTVT